MYENIINNFLESDEMIRYLDSKPIYYINIITMICSSVHPLDEKIKFLKELYNTSDDNVLLDTIDNTLEMYDKCMKSLESDGLFAIEYCFYDISTNSIREEFINICASYHDVINYINNEDCVDNRYQWWKISKWEILASNQSRKISEYIIVNNELCYCGMFHNDIFESDFDPTNELHLSVPFKPGDILEIDGYPFNPKTIILVLSIGDNKDCCSFQALSKNNHCKFETGAVCHNDIKKWDYIRISPLFTAKKYNGELDKDTKFFVKLSKYLKDNPDMIEKIWEYLSIRSMTTEEITDWVNNGCKLE